MRCKTKEPLASRQGLLCLYVWRALEQLVALDVLEVLVGGYLQFVGSLLVADDDAVLVHLEGRDGPHVVHRTLYGGLHGTGLGMAVHQDHHLTGIHHGAYTDGECVSRHVLGLTAEEAAVGNARVGDSGASAVAQVLGKCIRGRRISPAP